MLWSRKDEEPEFRPLADGVDDSEDADSRQSVEQPLRRRPSRRRANRLVYCCISVLFVVSNLISILLGGLISKQVRDLDSICAAHTNKYCKAAGQDPEQQRQLTIPLAPVLKDVKIRFEDMKFNGSFMDVNIYRQRGSPEVDAAWEALGVNCKSNSSSGTRETVTPHGQRIF